MKSRDADGEITQTELKKLLHYDPNTGVFRWMSKAAKNVVIGTVAGSFHSRGYQCIRLRKKDYLGHRLAWLYTHGFFPPQGVDHINGVQGDNRITNLRVAGQGENLQNQRVPPAHNTSGFLGVSFHKQHRRWRAHIKMNRKYIHLGYFSTPQEAHQAYLKAKRRIHPFGMI